MAAVIALNEIRIEDKALFDRYLRQRVHVNSEFTFTNLFIWRHAYRFLYAVIEDYLCLLGHYRGKMPMLFLPIGGGDSKFVNVMERLADYFSSNGTPFVMKAVTEHQKELLEAAMPGSFLFKDDRNNYDYIYNTQDLVLLQGKKYRQKRNHLNRFKASYTYALEPIGPDNIVECNETAQSWADQRVEDEGIQEERRAILDLFEHYEALEVFGAALRIGGSIQAFTLAEALNQDTAVIHIEKANIEYHGSYTAINQMFAEQYLQDFTYINREEDMGLPGLRKAKASYYPCRMIVKYTAFLNA